MNKLSLKNRNSKKNDDAAKAFVDDMLDITETLDVKAEADKLEAHLANGDDDDRAALAALELRSFQPSIYCRTLVELAVENLCNEPSAKLDEIARDKAKFRKEILEVARHDIGVACSFIAQTAPLDDVPNLIYSLCFNVVKAAVFLGNIHYRRLLDPKADFDLEQFIDQREEHREKPYGLEADSVTLVEDIRVLKSAWFNEAPEQLVLDGIRDVHLFMGLIATSFGWEDENGMPYMYDMQPDGSFKAIYDVSHAVDMIEVKRQAARIKREAEAAEARRVTVARAARLAESFFARR